MPRNANKDKLSNYSVEFDNTNANWIQTNASWITDLGLNGASVLSVSIWLKPSSSAPTTAMSATSSPYNSGWNDNFNIKYDAGNTAMIFTGGSSASNKFYNNSVTLATDEWHHVVFVFTPSGTAAQRTRCWINNSEIANQATNLWVNLHNPGFPLYIGRLFYGAGGSTNQWVGEISQFCIFDYALSTNQINYLYNLNNPMATTGGEPVAYWPLGDNSNLNAPASFPNISVEADSVFQTVESNVWPNSLIFPDSLKSAQKITFAFWFNTTSTAPAGPVGYTLATRGSISSVTGCFALMVRNLSGKKFQCWFYDGSGTTPNPILGHDTDFTDYNDGQWHHMAVTIDGTLPQTALKMYLDGELASSAISANTGINIPTGNDSGNIANADIILGQRKATYSALGAKYSNLCTFDDALDDIAIASLYNNGVPPDVSSYNNLTGWWPLNQSSNYDEGQRLNWTITRSGTANAGGANDGCYSVNPGLRWHDTNDDLVSSGNFFQWNSPPYKTNGTNIVLSSSGGEWVTFYQGNEIILEYSIDYGAWTLWHQETNAGSTGSSPVTFTIPSTGNLTVSDNIRVRVKGCDYGSTAPVTSYIQLYNVQISGGTFSYTEDFNETQRYGWFNNNGGLNPPSSFNPEPFWQLPDARSAYPQSFSFKQNQIIRTPNNVFDSIVTSPNKIGVCTISYWIKNERPYVQQDYMSLNDAGPGLTNSAYFRIDSNNKILYHNGSNYMRWPAPSTNSYSHKLNGWNHHCWVFNSATSYSTPQGQTNGDLEFYLNGEIQAVDWNNAAAPSGDAWNGFNIGEAGQASGNGLDFCMSNLMLYNTNFDGAKVLQLYNNGVPLTTAIEPNNLVTWLKLDNTAVWYANIGQWGIPNAGSTNTQIVNFSN